MSDNVSCLSSYSLAGETFSLERPQNLFVLRSQFGLNRASKLAALTMNRTHYTFAAVLCEAGQLSRTYDPLETEF